MRHLPIFVLLLLSACAVPPGQQVAAPAPPPSAPPPVQPVALAAAPVPPASSPAPPALTVEPVVVAGSPSPGVVGVAVPPLGLALNLPAVPNPIYSFLPEPVPGRLTLSNFSFDHAQIETIMPASGNCYTRMAGDIEGRFELPLNGTRIVTAPPGRDVCWRRKLDPGDPTVGVVPGWTDWNRAFVAYGTRVNAKL